MKEFTFRLTFFDRCIYFLMAGLILAIQGAFVYVLVIYAPKAVQKPFDDITAENPILLYAYVASWFVTIITLYTCLAYTVVRDNSSLVIGEDSLTLDRAGPPPFSGFRRRQTVLLHEIRDIDLAGISLARPGKKKLKIVAGRKKITFILDDLREIGDEEILPPYKGNWRQHPLVAFLRDRVVRANIT